MKLFTERFLTTSGSVRGGQMYEDEEKTNEYSQKQDTKYVSEKEKKEIGEEKINS